MRERKMDAWREIAFADLISTPRDMRTVGVFLFEADGRARLRACSRPIVEALLRAYDPRARLYKDARGKPRVSGCTLHVSVAHSGPCLVVAIGSANLGVDIEFLRYPASWKRVYCWMNEAADRLAFPDEHDFLACWTAKESLLKLLGTGLDFGLRKLSVPSSRFAGWRMATAGCTRHWLKPLPRWNAMVAFLALNQPDVVETYRVVHFHHQLVVNPFCRSDGKGRSDE